jgi:small subunit ribosomal protein S18
MANKSEVDNPIETSSPTTAAETGATEIKRAPRRPGPPRGPQQQQRPYNRGGGDDDGGRGPGGKRGNFFQGRRKVCPVKIEDVDWKKLDSLRYFVSESGSIRSRRKTGANAKLQRRVAVAVKRARHMALLPYTSEHVRVVNKR